MTYRKGEPPTETLLTELCTHDGICLGPDDRAAMMAMPTDDLDAWAKEIFKREGLGEPLQRNGLWQHVRAHVERHLRGAERP